MFFSTHFIKAYILQYLNKGVIRIFEFKIISFNLNTFMLQYFAESKHSPEIKYSP